MDAQANGRARLGAAFATSRVGQRESECLAATSSLLALGTSIFPWPSLAIGSQPPLAMQASDQAAAEEAPAQVPTSAFAAVRAELQERP